MVSPAHVAAVVFLVGLLASGRREQEINDKKHNQFALDLYQAMRPISQNIVASPLSLEIILAMAQQGAGGTTAEEISKVLHHAGNHSEVLGAYKALIQELQKPELKMATKMFVEKSFNIYPDFQNISTTNFLSTVQGIDLKGNPEGSRKEINDWVDNNTNHKIKDLFRQGSLTPDSKLLLVNAIHFKGKWMNQFNAKNTIDDLFYITPEQAVPVKMMSLFRGNVSFTYSEKLKSTILEIPYEKKEFRMIIILPYAYDGLAEAESKLTSADDFSELLQLRNGNIDVELPRFKLEETMDLESILQKMGMPTAFTDLADFSKISNENLKISKVTQKAYIEVNEEGTEAAAATAGEFIPISLPPRIQCNHPFMYVILKGNKILFIGRLIKPNGKVIDSPLNKQFQ